VLNQECKNFFLIKFNKNLFISRMVIAPWKNEKGGDDETIGYYRGWIRSIEGEMCRIVFVDYGNECEIERSKLLSCPSSVACLPWLAIRVRFQQYLSHDEFKRFWYRTDSHWIKIKVVRVHNTHYTIQVFIDYTSVILPEDRRMKRCLKDKLNQSIDKVFYFYFYLYSYLFIFYFSQMKI